MGILTLFEALLKDEGERKLIASIIQEKNNEEIIELFLRKPRK